MSAFTHQPSIHKHAKICDYYAGTHSFAKQLSLDRHMRRSDGIQTRAQHVYIKRRNEERLRREIDPIECTRVSVVPHVT